MSRSKEAWEEAQRVEAAKKSGLTPAQLNAENEKFEDWATQCPHCSQYQIGTLKQIREHVCERPTEVVR